MTRWGPAWPVLIYRSRICLKHTVCCSRWRNADSTIILDSTLKGHNHEFLCWRTFFCHWIYSLAWTSSERLCTRYPLTQTPPQHQMLSDLLPCRHPLSRPALLPATACAGQTVICHANPESLARFSLKSWDIYTSKPTGRTTPSKASILRFDKLQQDLTASGVGWRFHWVAQLCLEHSCARMPAQLWSTQGWPSSLYSAFS